MIACLAWAPSAGAFSLEDVTVTPDTPQAGAHSNLSLGFTIADPEPDLKKLVVHLPPGLIGNPLATPTCSEAELNAASCPPASDVGDVSNDVVIAWNENTSAVRKRVIQSCNCSSVVTVE